MRFELIAPWPPKELSPNSRKHWAAKSAKARAYRATCFAIAHNARIQAGLGKLSVDDKTRLTLTFCPPDNRRRDDDNMIASFKSGRDGIAEALGIDDNQFVTTFSVGDVVAVGSVMVVIEQ